MPTIWPRLQGAMSILEPTSGELGAFPQQDGSAVVCGRGAGHGTGVHGGAARPGSTGVRARRAEPGAGRGAVRGRREHALSLAVELTESTPIAKASVTLGRIAQALPVTRSPSARSPHQLGSKGRRRANGNTEHTPSPSGAMSAVSDRHQEPPEAPPPVRNRPFPGRSEQSVRNLAVQAFGRGPTSGQPFRTDPVMPRTFA